MLPPLNASPRLPRCSRSEGLDAAAQAAWAAFNGAGVDYVVHNAGGWVDGTSALVLGTLTDGHSSAGVAAPPRCRKAHPDLRPPTPPSPSAAGASQHAAVEDTRPDVAAALLRLNLEGPLALARAALPRMAAQGRGRHVVVASMSGEAGGGRRGTGGRMPSAAARQAAAAQAEAWRQRRRVDSPARLAAPSLPPACHSRGAVPGAGGVRGRQGRAARLLPLPVQRAVGCADRE